MKGVKTVMTDTIVSFFVSLLILEHSSCGIIVCLKQCVLFEQDMVIKKDDPVIKAIALAWRCKSLVLCLALICSVMTQVTKYLSRFPTCEVKITFHLAWEFYLASHGQTASCSSIAAIEIWKVYEHCKVLINVKEEGFCLWCSLACGRHWFFGPQFRKPHLPLGEHRSSDKIITAGADEWQPGYSSCQD